MLLERERTFGVVWRFFSSCSQGSIPVRPLLINILHHDRREGEMDEAQEGGRLKRHMKGQHIEGKGGVTVGSFSDGEGGEMVNE